VTRRAPALTVAVLLSQLLATAPVAGAADRVLIGPLGRGAAQVWVLEPPQAPRAVVVFAHGWRWSPPRTRDQWPAQFAPWLDHLLSLGDAVVFPRYQVGGDADTGRARALSLRRGLVAGFALLGRPAVPVVAVGYSFGGSLAFAYAANARRWGLPEPAAVDGIFPAEPIAGEPMPAPPSSLRALLEVGDRDVIAGSVGADELWRWLDPLPRGMRRYVVVRSVPGLAATHAAPKRTSAVAQRLFWAPLDRLVADAVASAG
jgi:hypothetical protein